MKQRDTFTASWVGRLLAGPAIVLAFSLPAAPAQAQDLHEIMGGSVGRIEEDIFECGRQRGSNEPCGLSYRYYCVDEPSEINSPTIPTKGFAGYRERNRYYVADAAHTGNFPKAANLGPGRVWHLLWDGIRNENTPEHIGYYAAVSQVIDRGELGNPYSLNCLPVTGQWACFGMIGPDTVNVARNTPLGDIPAQGGLSPIPVPLLQRNGLDTVSLSWEQAAGQISRDGADLPIEGYRLFIYPNPIMPPTEKELADKAIPVGDIIPVDTTSMDLKRSTEGLADAVTMVAALKMVYRGGLESMYFSANGPQTGLAFPDNAATRQMDDSTTGGGAVSRAIDIEDLFLETRQVKGASDDAADQAYLLATVNLIGEPDGTLLEGTEVRVFIDFNDEGLGNTFEEPGKAGTAEITLEARLGKQDGDKAGVTFTGLDGIKTHSRLDSRGRVVFAVPVAAVTSAVDNDKLRAADAGGGRRQLLVWAESRRGKDADQVPNTDDGKGPSVAGEVIKFTF